MNKLYAIHWNGKISTRKGKSAVDNVIFACLKDSEIRYANEMLEKDSVSKGAYGT